MPFYQRKCTKIYNNTTEKQVKRGKINVFDHLDSTTPPTLMQEYGEMGDFLRVADASRAVVIDSIALFAKVSQMQRYSTAIYLHLLTLLEDNRQPIRIHNTQLRNAATNLTRRITFEPYLNALIDSGLVFRYRSHEFYINPMYAWVGDRAQYFDADYLPIVEVQPTDNA